jgi:hypothetical protein
VVMLSNGSSDSPPLDAGPYPLPFWPNRSQLEGMYETMDGNAERNRPTTSSHTAIPLAPLPDSVAARVQQAGAPGVNLYRALGNAPRLLEARIDFAWALREHCDTTRRLRELVILRTAKCMLSQYEWNQHRLMVAEAGVDYLARARWESEAVLR